MDARPLEVVVAVQSGAQKNGSLDLGWGMYAFGWAVFVLTIVTAMSGKTSEPHSHAPFLFLFGILVAVSLVYCFGCLASETWRAKTIRRNFSPYLLGSAGWLTLFLLFWFLDRYAG